MNKKNICFIGYGKMIQGIIQSIDLARFSVSITTKSDKQNNFNHHTLSYYQFDLLNDSFPTQVIEEVDILVFSLPPLDIKSFSQFFDKVPLDKRIIFTSSISIYQKDQGEINESGLQNSHDQSVLVQCETFLTKRFKNLVILRLGGLYGKNRHPIYSLAGKSELKGSNELIHLVHHQDVQQAIIKIIELNITQGIYNIISDQRESKKAYYTNMAKKLSLSPPLFNESLKSETPNNISNQKSKDDLKLIYQNPNDFLGVENE